MNGVLKMNLASFRLKVDFKDLFAREIGPLGNPDSRGNCRILRHCPFQDGKFECFLSPNINNGKFKCVFCNLSGDYLDLIMKHLEVDREQAKEVFSNRIGTKYEQRN